MPSVVGIDFGTSNSAVAGLIDGKTEVIADERGNRLTPSVVSFGKNKQILIGADAKAQAYNNSKRTIHSIKRLIGRKSYSQEVEKSRALLPFEIVEGEEQNAIVRIDDQSYAPQEIASFIIKHMKAIAEAKLGDSVEECVITVPAYFNDSQRMATKEACEIAGLSVLRVINEPTAAALAYGFGKNLNETIAVYDLGGGTFDISILKLKGGVFEVISTAGDTFLGGDDFDDRIIDICAQDFLKKHEIDLRSIPEALPLLRANAEKTKKRLSYAERSDVYVPGIIKKKGQDLDLHFTMSRAQLKEQCTDLIQRTFGVCDEALREAKVSASDLDAVILVGGPTKMPLIYEACQSYFGKEPLAEHNPDETVAIGAHIQAMSLKSSNEKSKALLLDVTPLDLGVATVDGYVETIIEKNSQVPKTKKKVFTTTKDKQSSVDIRIFQGRNRRVEESTLLGEFSLSGFSPKPVGEAEIEVSFSINTDGIVEVSAVDKETGNAQNVSVRMSAALGKQNVNESAKRFDEYKQVRLKDEWKDASKILMYLPSTTGVGSQHFEGYIRGFNPLATELSFYNNSKNFKQEEIERKRLGWVAVIDDFSNIPRYLSAIQKKPEHIVKPPRFKLHEFTLTNGDRVVAQVEKPKLEEEGFWVFPYFPNDDLPGKIFMFSSWIKDVSAINV